MTTLRPFRPALFACLLSTFAALPAQQKSDPPAAAPTTGQSAAAAAPTLDFSFTGGTFGELCTVLAEIGERVHCNVNIVIEPDAAAVVLPKVQVRNAGLAQVLEAACAAASSDEVVLHVKELRGSGSPVFAVVARAPQKSPGANAAAVGREITAVHSLGGLLRDGGRGIGFTPETILSAIETATGEMPLRALRYHTDSRLLIARGTQENLSVVAEVLRELEQDVRRQEQMRKASEAHPGAGKASNEPPKAGATKDQAETR